MSLTIHTTIADFTQPSGSQVGPPDFWLSTDLLPLEKALAQPRLEPRTSRLTFGRVLMSGETFSERLSTGDVCRQGCHLHYMLAWLILGRPATAACSVYGSFKFFAAYFAKHYKQFLPVGLIHLIGLSCEGVESWNSKIVAKSVY